VGGHGDDESDVVTMEEIVHMEEPDLSYLSHLEFIARTDNINAENSRLSILINGSIILASEIQMTSTFHLYHFDLPFAELVESVTFCRHEALGSFLVCEKDIIEFDPTFGILFNGEDISSTLRLDSTNNIHDWLTHGRSMLPMHVAARKGCLDAIPAQFTMEKSLEFIVSATCQGTLDVYVNGFSVICSRNVLPGSLMKSTLTRIAFAPLTCGVKSVVFHLRITGGGGEIKLDPSFGVMLGGQDCLPSVSFVGEDGTPDPHRWPSKSAEWQQLKSGIWCWSGFYHMLPYVAKRKPHERVPGGHRV
jgi:hypothetical protein